MIQKRGACSPFFFIKLLIDNIMIKTQPFFLLPFIFLFYHCDKKFDKDILASAGSAQVTSIDFIHAYSNRLIKSQTKDSEFERNRVLNELIRTKLFSEAARSKKLSLDSIGISRIKLTKEKALREELYEELIGSNKTVIHDSIIRKHFQWQHTEIMLKHLFHPDKKVLDTILPMVKKDSKRFDVFAKNLFNNYELKNSGGSLGWVSYNTIDPNLEQVAFSMPFDIPIGPVRSSYGWHILLKKDERKQMILDEDHYQIAKKSLYNLISKKQSQIIANDYVNDLMGNNVSINDSLSIRVLEQINTIVFQKKKNNNKINLKTGERLTDIILDLKLNHDMVLASYQNNRFTVNDLLHGLRNSKPSIFLNNPVQAFYIALRNQILTTEAIDRGLLNRKKVKQKIKSTEDQYLAQKYLKLILKNKQKSTLSSIETKEITENLKKNFPVIIYKHNFDNIF